MAAMRGIVLVWQKNGPAEIDLVWQLCLELLVLGDWKYNLPFLFLKRRKLCDSNVCNRAVGQDEIK